MWNGMGGNDWKGTDTYFKWKFASLYPSRERLEAMRKQCGKNCPCKDDGVVCAVKQVEERIKLMERLAEND